MLHYLNFGAKAYQFYILQERTLEYVDSVNSQDYKIVDGVYLKRTNESVTKDEINQESIPEDATARSSRLNQLLFEKALNFLKTRVLEIRVPDETIDGIEQSSDESNSNFNNFNAKN